MKNPTQFWGETTMQLLAFEAMPRDGQQPPSSLENPLGSARMDIQMRLLLEEQPVAADVDTAILAWPQDPRPWERLGGLGVYFLRLRVESSLEFISSAAGWTDHEGRAMFLPPDHASPVDFARYLLTDWWSSSGREAAARRIISDHHDSITKKRAP